MPFFIRKSLVVIEAACRYLHKTPQEVAIIKQILIVEDDQSLSSGIALALRDGELSVTKARDLHAARVAVNHTAFDLIILDLNLADGNGLDFLKELRQTSQVPVVVLTANDLFLSCGTSASTASSKPSAPPADSCGAAFGGRR